MSSVESNKMSKKTHLLDLDSDIMPRNAVKKDELECRVLKLKNELYNGSWSSRGQDWHDGAHTMLNRVLEMLSEYRF